MATKKAEKAASPARAIQVEQVGELTKRFARSRANRIARNAVTADGVAKAARNPIAFRAYAKPFDVSLEAPTLVTNQKKTGRCWLFTTYNTLRQRWARAIDCGSVDFSHAYGQFFDKLEKANSFLGHVIETIDRPYDDRVVEHLMRHPIPDGGEWRFAANLIEKWGMVPAEVMPETICSEDSDQMNAMLERLLRKDAGVLRRAFREGAGIDVLRDMVEEMLFAVHRVLCVCLGEPPVHFDLVVEMGPEATLDDEHHVGATVEIQGPLEGPGGHAEERKGSKRILKHRNLTPQAFAKDYLGYDASDYVDLISFPLDDPPFRQVYGVRWLDSVVGGEPMRFLNVPMDELEDAAIASLDAGEACYFGCNVGQNSPRTLEDFPGILGLDTMDYDGLFDIDLTMEKGEMFELREAYLTHAMTLQGYSRGSNGRPSAWRVENSWGKESCDQGYFTITEDWWRLYSGEVVVRRCFVDEKTLELWDSGKAQMTEPWGVIARREL